MLPSQGDFLSSPSSVHSQLTSWSFPLRMLGVTSKRALASCQDCCQIELKALLTEALHLLVSKPCPTLQECSIIDHQPLFFTKPNLK